MTPRRAPPGPLVRVVKVGGSLLDWPDLPRALRQWLAAQAAGLSVLVAGGGALADAIRRADAAFALGDEAAHWLCIDALGVSAGLLAAILGEPRTLVSSLTELEQRIASGNADLFVLDPRDFLQHDEPRLPGNVVPYDWSATSDSIAARIATAIAADELVLLKSCDPPPHNSLDELAAFAYVDAFFPQATAGLAARLRLVNLRGDIGPRA